MKSRDAMLKEKEKTEKMKALRKELETELEQQLSTEQEQMQKDGRVEVHKVNLNQHLEENEAREVLEALLFASSKPLTISDIRKVVKGYTPKQIENLILELKKFYEEQNRSFEILEIAGGYELATKKEFAPWIMKVELQKKARQATQSALETLAILAYKQPITRAEAEELRGVDVSGVMNTLVERGFVKIVGRKEVPGRPFLYGTTEKFLEHFGLKSLKELPNIEEIKSVVENSVKKEELIGKKQMVAADAENNGETETPAEKEDEVNNDDGEKAVEEDKKESGELEASEQNSEEIPVSQTEEEKERGAE